MAARSGRSLEGDLRGRLVKMVETPDPGELIGEIRSRVLRSETRPPSFDILDHPDADRR